MANKTTLEMLEKRSEDMAAFCPKPPKTGSVGFYCWGDAPGGIGGGVGAFLWQASRAGMIRFVRKYALFLNRPRSDLNLLAVNAEVEAITDRMSAGTLSDVAAIKALNKALRHATQFDWIGDYRELTDGNTSFAKALRKRFRDGSSAAAVARAEKEDWLEFLDLEGA